MMVDALINMKQTIMMPVYEGNNDFMVINPNREGIVKNSYLQNHITLPLEKRHKIFLRQKKLIEENSKHDLIEHLQFLANPDKFPKHLKDKNQKRVRKYVNMGNGVISTEEELKKLGYKLIEINKNNNVYSEISSHVDIFTCKIKEKIVVENTAYENLKSQLKNMKEILVKGTSIVQNEYPNDIYYNVCIVGNKAIHNFKYTDSKIVQELKKNNFELINVKQGYSNCSIAVIDENSIILSDRGLYNVLKDSGFDVLFLDYKPNIKLFNENGKYSEMSGFIGGAITRIANNIIIFGDLNKIDNNGYIRSFIKERNLEIIDFKGLDVVDYGGIIEIGTV